MPKLDIEVMEFDELWLLHEELTKIFRKRSSSKSSSWKSAWRGSTGRSRAAMQKTPLWRRGLTDRRGVNIQGFYPNIAIQPRPLKPGPVAASSLGGSLRRSSPGINWRNSGSTAPKMYLAKPFRVAEAPRLVQRDALSREWRHRK